MKFMIICTECGHKFWRTLPCQKTLRVWDCPRGRRSTIPHYTRLSTTAEQMAAVAAIRKEQSND